MQISTQETPGLLELTRREDTGALGSEGVSLDVTSTAAVPQHAPETTIDTDENVALDPLLHPCSQAQLYDPQSSRPLHLIG